VVVTQSELIRSDTTIIYYVCKLGFFVLLLKITKAIKNISTDKLLLLKRHGIKDGFIYHLSQLIHLKLPLKITQLALYKCEWVTKESKESLCLGNAEKFQIWRAVLTYDQPKMSSLSVIRGIEVTFGFCRFLSFIMNC
jgi:hypothetical protein